MKKKNLVTLIFVFLLLISNIFWSFLGLFIALIHVPYSLSYNRNSMAIVIRGKYTSILDAMPGYQNWRGIALGNVVILNPSEEQGDQLHESVHIEQFMRYPFIFPFLNMIETYRHGYRQNRFEVEAYSQAGNNYYPNQPFFYVSRIHLVLLS